MTGSDKRAWFRLYSETVDDEKLRMLAFEDRWHFIALLCCKGQGILEDGGPLMYRKVAVKLGLDLRSLEEVARRLEEVDLIDAGTLQPTGWDKRQRKSDIDESRADRQRRFREKNTKPVSNALRNGTVTLPETETETETETEVNPISPKGDMSAACADGPVDNFLEPPKLNGKHAPICPHQVILDLYHNRLPQCVPVRVWNDTRRKHLQALWRNKAAEMKWENQTEGIEWFDAYFDFVGQSVFLTGKTDPKDGRKPFIADLEWLIRPNNFAKVVEGKYHT